MLEGYAETIFGVRYPFRAAPAAEAAVPAADVEVGIATAGVRTAVDAKSAVVKAQAGNGESPHVATREAGVSAEGTLLESGPEVGVGVGSGKDEGMVWVWFEYGWLSKRKSGRKETVYGYRKRRRRGRRGRGVVGLVCSWCLMCHALVSSAV